MSARTESILWIIVIALVILATILLPRTEWYRELQRLVPTPGPWMEPESYW